MCVYLYIFLKNFTKYLCILQYRKKKNLIHDIIHDLTTMLVTTLFLNKKKEIKKIYAREEIQTFHTHTHTPPKINK